jgi:hypothetical protein
MTTIIGRVVRVLGLATRKVVVAPREAALRARMAAWVVLISVVARQTSLTRAQKIISSTVRPTSVGDGSDTPAELGRAIDSVLGMDLFVFRRSCWKRAMVLQRFLALNGIDSRINFGVRKALDGTVDGHAWLEHQGLAFLENNPVTYVVTFSLPQ